MIQDRYGTVSFGKSRECVFAYGCQAISVAWLVKRFGQRLVCRTLFFIIKGTEVPSDSFKIQSIVPMMPLCIRSPDRRRRCTSLNLRNRVIVLASTASQSVFR